MGNLSPRPITRLRDHTSRTHRSRCNGETTELVSPSERVIVAFCDDCNAAIVIVDNRLVARQSIPFTEDGWTQFLTQSAINLEDEAHMIVPTEELLNLAESMRE